MKRLIVIFLTLSLLLGLCAIPVSAAKDASADLVEAKDVTGSYYYYSDADGMPESAHNYDNYTDVSWYIVREGATSISVTFSSDTQLENGYDYIEIYDCTDSLVGTYTYDQLMGETVAVSGDVMRIRLDTDGSVTYYGFRVVDIYTDGGTDFTPYRDTVLLLDNSVSMEGAPLDALKTAAKDFCQAMLASGTGNRIALVIYDTELVNVCNFTSNIYLLENAINAMDGDGSWTNTVTAVDKADELLSNTDALIKNLIIFTDGLPTYGYAESDGRYDYDDIDTYYGYTGHYVYEFANGLYQNVSELKDDYNIFTFGFFHNMYDYEREFGIRLLNDLQNAGYYEVTDPALLSDAFDEVINHLTHPACTATLVDNGDGTITLTVTLPEDIANGAFNVFWSELLEYIDDSYSTDIGDSVSGECNIVQNDNGFEVSFASSAKFPRGAVALRARFNVAAGASIGKEDITFEQWSLSDGDTVLSTQENRDFIINIVPFDSDSVHTVTFIDWDGSVIQTLTVTDGESLEFQHGLERVGYEFTGWSESLENITGDLTVYAQYERTYLIGDANLDGIVDSLDAATILKYDAGLITLSDLALLCADVSWNGVVDSLDAAMILKFDADILANLPQCPLYGLNADGTYFRAGEEQTITFTVNGGIPYGLVELYDQYDNYLGVMKDDGTDGDNRAGDGVYTCVTTVTYYVDGLYSNIFFYCTGDGDVSELLYLTFLSNESGSLSGRVCTAYDFATPIQNARVQVYGGVSLYTTVYTDVNGLYSINLPDGYYKVVISAEGYIPFVSYAEIENGYDTYLETFLLIEESADETGIAGGTVKNSLTGVGEAGVTLMFVENWNNTDAHADVIATVDTDSYGEYEIELPLGNYTVVAVKEDYTTSYFNIVVQAGYTYNQDGVITPIFVDGDLGDNYLITLTWDANPRDLDSHVRGTLSNGNEFHVYYADKYEYDGDTEVCNLDYDDTSGYGPEHITLVPTTGEAYYYYIYRYAGSGYVSTSGAKVTVERGNRIIATFNVPTDLGTGDYWNIFAIKNGELIIENSITNSYDCSYAD